MDYANDIIGVLLNFIENKRRLFDNIMEITLEQKKDIEENEANNIEELVNRKQSVIDSIDEIDRAFSEKFELLKKHLNVSALEEIDFVKYPKLRDLKQKVEEIMSLAREIMQTEEYNRSRLTSRMNDLKKEMNHISVGKKSIKAYETAPAYNDGIYIDKKK